MLGIGANLIKSAYRRGLAYVRDGLKLYMPYRGANHSEVKFVGEGSAVFDGTGDYVTLPDVADLDITDDLTMMCWLKPANTTNQFIMGRDDGTNRNYAIDIDGSNALEFYFSVGDTLHTVSSGTINADQWYHVTATREKSTGKNILYLDGVVVDSDTDSTGAIDDDNVQFTIGRRGAGLDFEGLMKNVAVWNRALTPTEVQNAMYKTYDELSGRLTSGLLRWYSLEDGTGSTAVDSTGTSNGTVSGSQGWKTTIYGGDTPVIPRAIDNAPTVQADGIGIGSASFNGSSDYISLGTVPMTTNHTISAWVYVTADANHKIIFDSRDANNDGILLKFNTDEDIVYELNDDDLTTAVQPANTWIHVAISYDGSTQKLYVNGVLDQSASVSETISVSSTAYIGARSHTSRADYYNGNICQVGLWSAALTQAQVLSVMAKTYDEFNSDDKTSLVSYWGLDVNANDSHGSNNGTLS